MRDFIDIVRHLRRTYRMTYLRAIRIAVQTCWKN